jgi:predicted transcriptional regulator
MDKEEVKVNQKGFINRIGGLWFDGVRSPVQKLKKDTYTQTREYVEQKKNIQEIAEIRNLTEGTILEHLEKLKKRGELPDISYLKPENTFFQQVIDLFKNLRTESLTPIMQALEKKEINATYEQLKVVRLFL